jgi:signal transduction histidine kinase
MRLSPFIAANLEKVLVEWEAFARRTIPATGTMTALAIRDHAREILQAIAADMESAQTEAQRHRKSEGEGPAAVGRSPADRHGSLRQLVGFDLNQLGAEYRALRATVLRLWMDDPDACAPSALEQVMRFNEGIDQALAESMASYSHHVGYSRDTFLAILGHDLRSPLGALAGCLDVLGIAGASAHQHARALQVGKRSVVSIGQMITDLLEYTRTRLGRGIDVVPREGDLGQICADALDEMRAAYPERRFESELGGDLHTHFDAPRIRQLLVNLLVNAVQHGDATHPVMLEADGRAERVVVAVRNRGKTIPPESLQVIFDPLVQIEGLGGEAHHRPSTSLGLGLYIAREIVHGHGGTIGVTSSDSDGTAFVVELPRGRGPD